MALLIMISFLIIAGCSNARLLMKNNLPVDPDTLSAFHPNTNALFDDDCNLHTANGPMEKKMIRSSSAESATDEKTLSLRLSSSVQKNYQGESSASNKAMDVNFMVTEQQLSKSSNHSLGTGQIQMIRPNSQSRNVQKSHQSNVDEHLPPKMSNKRKLGSTPGPGDGI